MPTEETQRYVYQGYWADDQNLLCNRHGTGIGILLYAKVLREQTTTTTYQIDLLRTVQTSAIV